MRVHSNFFLVVLARKLILIILLAVFLSGSLVFAQDPKHAIDSEIDAEYFVLIVTKGNSLNVRQTPSASSPAVASLPNNSKVPFVSSTNNAASGKGTWFQVEYSKGKLGWVSSGYSRKVKRFKNMATSQAANLESNGLATDAEYLVLITSSKSLNVRKQSTVLSPVVGRLPSGSKVPFIKSGDRATGKENWYQVEYAQGKFGWVSKDYSRKIKAPKNEPTPKRVAKLESKSQASVEEVKPVAKTNKNNTQNSLRSADIVKKPVVEVEADSSPIESQGFFKKLFSSKTKKPDKKAPQKAEVKGEKPWANIDGFRSAKFGMGREEVTKAIFQDFGIASRNITIINHPIEGTQSLAVTVKDLLPNSGSSRIVYVFGFRSKRLMLVNMLTGHPADAAVAPQQVVDSGNLLGNHLLRKRYQDDGLVAHAKLNDGSVLIFRGKDQKGRMVLLRLSDPQSSNEDNEGLKIALNLSYIEKPGEPDVYKLKEGDF